MVNIKQEVLQSSGQHYTIAVPDGYPGDEPVPLVLALHFAGHGTPYYGRTILEYLVEPALRDLGAIILAPDCTAEAWSEFSSERDVLNLLDIVMKSYKVDKNRVLLVGYSMGGNGAWYLAAHNPDRFSVALVMSGWPPAEIGQVDWQVPAYVIHSRDDEFVPIGATQSAVSSLREHGAEIEFIILEGITHFETHHFISPLKSAVPWIKRIWQAAKQ